MLDDLSHADPDDAPDTSHGHASPTAHLLEELALYGYRPGTDEPDPRPLPDSDAVACGIDTAFDALESMLASTRLEDDFAEIAWALTNVFHRGIDRLERRLDDNELLQRAAQAEQDGSEVKAVELERLVAQGVSLIERRNAFEFLRDRAAETFETSTGTMWRPRGGSKVNRRALTSAIIDSRDFIAARRRADAQVLIPEGTLVAFTGGAEFNEHDRIWQVLDKTHVKHPDMVLLHGGNKHGAERIAACWAQARGVREIEFRPDWARHRKAAPFKRNDELLAALPVGVIAFPGGGISANLADKARVMGIPVWRFDA